MQNDAVVINGEVVELLCDGRLNVYKLYPAGTRLFDASCTPPTGVPIYTEGPDAGLTVLRLVTMSPYFAFLPDGPQPHEAKPVEPTHSDPAPASMSLSLRKEHSEARLKAFVRHLKPTNQAKDEVQKTAPMMYRYVMVHGIGKEVSAQTIGVRFEELLNFVYEADICMWTSRPRESASHVRKTSRGYAFVDLMRLVEAAHILAEKFIQFANGDFAHIVGSDFRPRIEPQMFDLMPTAVGPPVRDDRRPQERAPVQQSQIPYHHSGNPQYADRLNHRQPYGGAMNGGIHSRVGPRQARIPQHASMGVRDNAVPLPRSKSTAPAAPTAYYLMTISEELTQSCVEDNILFPSRGTEMSLNAEVHQTNVIIIVRYDKKATIFGVAQMCREKVKKPQQGAVNVRWLCWGVDTAVKNISAQLLDDLSDEHRGLAEFPDGHLLARFDPGLRSSGQAEACAILCDQLLNTKGSARSYRKTTPMQR